PVNRSAGGGNFFIRPGGVFLVENGRAKIVPAAGVANPSPAVRYAVQSGPMLIAGKPLRRRRELLYPPRRRIPGGKRPGENRAGCR
ncbi:hypothetical protein CQA81_31310, partial [Klebsiella pneumoniae]